MLASGNCSVCFKIHPISMYFSLFLCLSRGKNAPRRLPCSCLAKCEFKLIFLNYVKRKTIPILRLVLSNLALCGSWDFLGLMVQQRHTEKILDSLTLLVVPPHLTFHLVGPW